MNDTDRVNLLAFLCWSVTLAGFVGIPGYRSHGLVSGLRRVARWWPVWLLALFGRLVLAPIVAQAMPGVWY